MELKTEEHFRVKKQFDDLGLSASEGIVLLPENLESAKRSSELLLRAEASTVKKLFRLSNVPVAELTASEYDPAYISNKAVDWISPGLFFSAAALSQNSDIVSVALNVLSNYLYDFFKGDLGQRSAKLDIVVEKPDGSCKKIAYEGPASGLAEVAKAVRKVMDE